MTPYYIEGTNISWILAIGLCLLAGSLFLALAMWVIPKKINLPLDRDVIFILSSITAIAAFFSILIITSRTFSMDELKAGEHWKNDCKLLEANIQTGTFTNSVNKLDCAGVTINVPKPEYDVYIRQWKLYEAKNK